VRLTYTRVMTFEKYMAVSASDFDAAWALRKDVFAGNAGMPRVYSMPKQPQQPQSEMAGLPKIHLLQPPHHHSVHSHAMHVSSSSQPYSPLVPFAPQQVHFEKFVVRACPVSNRPPVRG
jgi:hypothetical protein